MNHSGRIGERVGMLVFTGLATRRGDGNRLYGEFACDCGKAAQLPVARVLNQRARTSCGCAVDRGAHRKHGMRKSPEYGSWMAMKARCCDPGNKDYPRWGGVGITIYPDWINSFEAFFSHMGKRPPGTSLDRIDNRLGYWPGNVRWATSREQQRNRKTSYRWSIKGRRFDALGDAATHFGVSQHTVWRWVNGQFDRRRNLFVPPREDCHVVSVY